MSLSKIEWCDFTHNPWWGCARVSPGCVHCYADTTATRWGHNTLWRRHGPRRVMSDQYWRQPLGWDRAAAQGGPTRVFCASMADVFEASPEPEVRAFQDKERARLWDLIEATPNLTWMLLTKRPQNVLGMAPWGRDGWPGNVWVGTSVEDQQRAAERIPVLRTIPAAVRFLSCEPLLAPVALRGGWLEPELLGFGSFGADVALAVDWVIVGGESGPGARPMEIEWARSLVAQCQAAEVPVFVKQLGSVWAKGRSADRKGGDPDDWPADLRIRDFPGPAGRAAVAS